MTHFNPPDVRIAIKCVKLCKNSRNAGNGGID